MAAIASHFEGIKERISGLAFNSVPIAPLITFRIVFGLIMTMSTARFIALGWIEKHFGNLNFSFSYYGFDWVRPLPVAGMYVVYFVMLLASLGVMLGAWYRISAVLLFSTFAYAQLADATYYLNHYYFIGLVCGWFCFVPANRDYSIDIWRGAVKGLTHVPAWSIRIFQF